MKCPRCGKSICDCLLEDPSFLARAVGQQLHLLGAEAPCPTTTESGDHAPTKSTIAHQIKHRDIPDDEFYTPPALAQQLVSLVEIADGDVLLDAAIGTGAFFGCYPSATTNLWTDDFHNFTRQVDWIVTNPPYSDIDRWLEHSCQLCRKGFAYLLGIDNLTPRRIEFCEEGGFGISTVHLCKVFRWYGISAFVIWQRGAAGILDYDRTVWGHPASNTAVYTSVSGNNARTTATCGCSPPLSNRSRPWE